MRPGKRLWLLMGVALVVRLALPASAYALRVAFPDLRTSLNTDIAEDVCLTGDSADYIRPATSLIENGRYDRVAGPDQPYAAGPETHRPPGYALLLVPGIATGHPFLVTVLLQALLGVMTVYVTFLTASMLFPPRISVGCAALAALEPGLILWSSKIMAETLVTACVAAAAFALVRYAGSRQTSWLAWSAAFIAAAAYVKPVAYFLPIWLAITLVAIFRQIRPAVVIVLVAAAILAPWHLRNAWVAGYYGFSTQIDSKIANSAPSVVASVQEGRPFSEVRRGADHYRFTGPVSDANFAAARARGIRTVLSAPGTYAWMHLTGMFRVLFHPGSIPYLEIFGLDPDWGAVGAIVLDHGSLAALRVIPFRYPLVFWTTAAMFVILLPYLLLPAAGIWRHRPDWPAAQLILMSLAAYFVVAAGGPWGQSRYRQPIMPVLCVLAGYGLTKTKLYSAD